MITATAAGGITASSTLKVEKIIVNIADTDIWVPYPTYTGGKQNLNGTIMSK